MTRAPDPSVPAADWTGGHPAILYQRCADCGRVWYLRRPFCPGCGGERVRAERASGRGTVYAATLVARAPTPELRALAPYRILLVDAEEGFRMMAHGALDPAIGDAVAARFRPFGALLVPYFERRSTRA